MYGQPQISELNAGRGFLCLDCEVFITSTKRSRESSIGGQSGENKLKNVQGILIFRENEGKDREF